MSRMVVDEGGRRLKELWRSGAATAGMWLRLTDWTIADMVAPLGFDFIICDAEHVAFDVETLQGICMALRGSPTVPLVRVPSGDPARIKVMLDLGMAGVVVPQIRSVEQARDAVAACKYPPRGCRGFGPRRPGRYGAADREYLRVADELTVVLVMVETGEAVSAIADILSVPDLDGVLLGPADLAVSMGCQGDPSQPPVRDALQRVAERVRAARVPFGDGRALADPRDLLAIGGQILLVGDDERFIREGAEAQLARYRDGLAPGR